MVKYVELEGTSVNDIMAIGPYELVKALGKGSYAIVKLGVHRTTGEKVAVKIVDKANGTNRSPKFLRRIEREIVSLREMKHPNITGYIDCYESKQFIIIVMEYINGCDLFHFLRKNALGSGLPPGLAFRFFYQLVSGLEYCHSYGIAHRDIKSENVLLNDAMDTVKLADFGMSNLIQPDQMMETSCGSPHYAAPEIVKGVRYHGRIADVWSLGVVLFGMCSGRLPFVHESIPRVLEMVVAGQYTMPSHFDASLRDLIGRMLHPSTKSRITLTQIKEHPYWVNNCGLLKLDLKGIPGLTQPEILRRESTAYVEEQMWNLQVNTDLDGDGNFEKLNSPGSPYSPYDSPRNQSPRFGASGAAADPSLSQNSTTSSQGQGQSPRNFSPPHRASIGEPLSRQGSLRVARQGSTSLDSPPNMSPKNPAPPPPGTFHRPSLADLGIAPKPPMSPRQLPPIVHRPSIGVSSISTPKESPQGSPQHRFSVDQGSPKGSISNMSNKTSPQPSPSSEVRPVIDANSQQAQTQGSPKNKPDGKVKSVLKSIRQIF